MTSNTDVKRQYCIRFGHSIQNPVLKHGGKFTSHLLRPEIRGNFGQRRSFVDKFGSIQSRFQLRPAQNHRLNRLESDLPEVRQQIAAQQPGIESERKPWAH
ncbi:MAG: hypothetical protein GY717_11165 [Rhodobacteraceae bacterium]|nr:hypothetical protein [Paracoccaceae bacterium]